MQALFTVESIARAAREVGDWDFAAWAAGQMREHDPGYGGTHFALGLVAQHNGDRDGARVAFESAERSWKDADPDLAELQVIRRELSQNREPKK